MSPSDFRGFRYRKRDFIHIENGWCVSELPSGDWRLYHGPLRDGADYPLIVLTHQELDETVQFQSFALAVQAIRGRRSPTKGRA